MIWCYGLMIYPSKHAGSDPEAFWLRPVMAITASVQPESGRIVYCRIRLPASVSAPFFQRGVDHIVQNRARSDLDGLVRVWPNASGLEASRCAGITGPGFWQDSPARYQFPTLQTRLRSSTDVPDVLCKTRPDPDLVLADCVRF